VTFGERVTEAIKSVFPSSALVADPRLGRSQATQLQVAGADPAALSGPDKAAVLEHLQVLHDRWQGHVERLGQFAHRGRTCDKAFDHAPPSAVSQSLKDPV
jgi:hypothetical protein